MVEEEFVSHIVKTVMRENANELKVLERDLSKLEHIAPPFPRITYDDAVTKLLEIQAQLRAGQPVLRHDGKPLEGIDDPALLDITWGMDFGAPHEDGPDPTVRQARVRHRLPHRHQSLLHGAISRPARGVQERGLAGAGGFTARLSAAASA